MKNTEKDFKEIQNHLKETGFIYQGSEIYGGLANTWDYGPLGVKLKNNILREWRDAFINKESNNFEVDTKILLNPKVWKASGHISSFNDPLIENKINKKRYRADKLIEEYDNSINAEVMTYDQMKQYLEENVKTHDGQKTEWSEIKEFHLMFETFQGVLKDKKEKIYLRPETAQGIFINFKNIQRSMGSKVPFGIGQVGKSFRNEVTPGNFIFRTREFEQMEFEYFVEPGRDMAAYKEYISKSLDFITHLGIGKESVRIREHKSDELAHYSRATADIEFKFTFGFGELMGITNRTDFDLKAHSALSGIELSYRDPLSNKTYFPYVIEPSVGLDRLLLAIVTDGYENEKTANESRRVLKLKPSIAPYKFAILPLSKKAHAPVAKKLFNSFIKKGIDVIYDDRGSIGKRYRRQDAIGTPYCLTIIDSTESEEKLTIRFRDDMKQEEIVIADLNKFNSDTK